MSSRRRQSNTSSRRSHSRHQDDDDDFINNDIHNTTQQSNRNPTQSSTYPTQPYQSPPQQSHTSSSIRPKIPLMINTNNRAGTNSPPLTTTPLTTTTTNTTSTTTQPDFVSTGFEAHITPRSNRRMKTLQKNEPNAIPQLNQQINSINECDEFDDDMNTSTFQPLIDVTPVMNINTTTSHHHSRISQHKLNHHTDQQQNQQQHQIITEQIIPDDSDNDFDQFTPIMRDVSQINSKPQQQSQFKQSDDFIAVTPIESNKNGNNNGLHKSFRNHWGPIPRQQQQQPSNGFIVPTPTATTSITTNNHQHLPPVNNDNNFNEMGSNNTSDLFNDTTFTTNPSTYHNSIHNQHNISVAHTNNNYNNNHYSTHESTNQHNNTINPSNQFNRPQFQRQQQHSMNQTFQQQDMNRFSQHNTSFVPSNDSDPFRHDVSQFSTIAELKNPQSIVKNQSFQPNRNFQQQNDGIIPPTPTYTTTDDDKSQLYNQNRSFRNNVSGNHNRSLLQQHPTSNNNNINTINQMNDTFADQMFNESILSKFTELSTHLDPSKSNTRPNTTLQSILQPNNNNGQIKNQQQQQHDDSFLSMGLSFDQSSMTKIHQMDNASVRKTPKNVPQQPNETFSNISFVNFQLIDDNDDDDSVNNKTSQSTHNSKSTTNHSKPHQQPSASTNLHSINHHNNFDGINAQIIDDHDDDETEELLINTTPNKLPQKDELLAISIQSQHIPPPTTTTTTNPTPNNRKKTNVTTNATTNSDASLDFSNMSMFSMISHHMPQNGNFLSPVLQNDQNNNNQKNISVHDDITTTTTTTNNNNNGPKLRRKLFSPTHTNIDSNMTSSLIQDITTTTTTDDIHNSTVNDKKRPFNLSGFNHPSNTQSNQQTIPPPTDFIQLTPESVVEYEIQLRDLYPLRHDQNLLLLAQLQLSTYLCSDRQLTSSSILSGSLLTQLKPQIGPSLQSTLSRAIFQQKRDQLFNELQLMYQHRNELIQRYPHLNFESPELSQHSINLQISNIKSKILQLSTNFNSNSFLIPSITSDHIINDFNAGSKDLFNTQQHQSEIDQISQFTTPYAIRPRLNEIEQLVLDLTRDKQYKRALWILESFSGITDDISNSTNSLHMLQSSSNPTQSNGVHILNNTTSPKVVYLCTCTRHLSNEQIKSNQQDPIIQSFLDQYYCTDPLEDPLYSTTSKNGDNNTISLLNSIEVENDTNNYQNYDNQHINTIGTTPLLDPALNPQYFDSSSTISTKNIFPSNFKVITCFLMYMRIHLKALTLLEDKHLRSFPSLANRYGLSNLPSSTNSTKTNLFTNSTNATQISDSHLNTLEELQQLSMTKQLTNDELISLCSLYNQHEVLIPCDSTGKKKAPGHIPDFKRHLFNTGLRSNVYQNGSKRSKFNNTTTTQPINSMNNDINNTNPSPTQTNPSSTSSQFLPTTLNFESFCPFLLHQHASLLAQMSTAHTPEPTSIIQSTTTSTGPIVSTSPIFLPSIITATPYLIQHLLLLSIQRLPTLFESWQLLEETIISTEQLSTIMLPLHPLTRLFITKMLSKLPSPNKDTLTQALFSLSITFPNTSVHSSMEFLVSKVLYDRSLPLHYTTTTQQTTTNIITTTTKPTSADQNNINSSIMSLDFMNDDDHQTNHQQHDVITKTIIEHHHQDDPRLRYYDFLELDPYNTDILLQYVEFLKETENLTDFTTLIQNLLSTQPTTNTTYIILSDYYSLLHELPKSIQCLKQALLLTTTTVTLSNIWLKLGIIYFQLLQKNYALISFYTSLLYNPDNISTSYYISYIYKRNKQYLLSITWLEKCLAKNKKNILYWLDLGENLYSLSSGGNNIEKPLRIYKFAISIASENNDYKSLFPLCLKVGSLLKSHSYNEEAADYFSIILDHILQIDQQQQQQQHDQSSKNKRNNNNSSTSTVNNIPHYNKHPYSYILEPQHILFLAEIRCNQGRFEIAKQYLTLLIQQYENQQQIGVKNQTMSNNLNTGGESIAQAKSMLKRCDAAIIQ